MKLITFIESWISTNGFPIVNFIDCPPRVASAFVIIRYFYFSSCEKSRRGEGVTSLSRFILTWLFGSLDANKGSAIWKLPHRHTYKSKSLWQAYYSYATFSLTFVLNEFSSARVRCAVVSITLTNVNISADEGSSTNRNVLNETLKNNHCQPVILRRFVCLFFFPLTRRIIIPSIALPWKERLEYISLDGLTVPLFENPRKTMRKHSLLAPFCDQQFLLRV